MSSPIESLAEQVIDWSRHGEIELTDEQLEAMADLLIHEHAVPVEVRRHDTRC